MLSPVTPRPLFRGCRCHAERYAHHHRGRTTRPPRAASRLSPTHRAADPVDAARGRRAARHRPGDDLPRRLVHASRTASIVEVEQALYDDRSLVRVLSMRRTVFAVPRDLVGCLPRPAPPTPSPASSADCSRSCSPRPRSPTIPAGWLREVESVAVAAIDDAGEITSAELGKVDERLATGSSWRAGTKYEATRPWRAGC